jgi:osmotically-inducible protein OsmY
MRVILALIVGILIGAAALWVYNTKPGRERVQSTADQVGSAVKSAGDAIQDKWRELNVRPEDIKEELARSGTVVRKKAGEAGKALADATADARITAAIKGKLVASRDLPGLSISVNTTEGIVTLSGSVPSADAISKAMVVALETDGVHQVISTMQVKPPAKAPAKPASP